MSRDYPLAPQTPAATDFWTQGGSAVLAPPMPAAPTGSSMSGGPVKLSALTRMHRLLRGRYPLAITLAATCAVACGIAGYAAIAPRYASIGMVTFDPRIVSAGPVDQQMQNFQQIMANHAAFMVSTNVAEDAMADPAYVAAYKKAYPRLPFPDDRAFIDGITVDRSRTASLIYCSYSDPSKAVTETAAKAVMNAYRNRYGSDEAIRNTESKIEYNSKRLNDVETKLASKTQERDDLIRQVQANGGLQELTDLEARTRQRWFDDQAALTAAQALYDEALNRVAHGSGQQNNNELVYEQIAALDQIMNFNLAARFTARAAVDTLQARGVLPSHPSYQQAVTARDVAERRVDEYAHEYLARHPDSIPYSLGTNGMTSLDAQKIKVEKLKARVEAERVQADQLAAAKQKVTELQADIGDLRALRTATETLILQLHDSEDLTKTIQVSMPGEATIGNDRRKAIAAVGFLGGGMLPLALMMLYGMKDSRFRYSDETAEADLAGVALLGILPNLPDRLSDPQQAGIAAHCVHQIRTMLQISRSNDEPQVLAITSASAGDGKTSLTLALGLSYAACGARTLLVDCDLLAAGLTHRLNVSSPDGILEAVANRALLEYVRTTDIADVAILPVGTTHAHHASTLSPVALRRLLSEAKKQFDIVIVDTGPILASIEASLICAAADRTILAVARNQQRPLVERSIGHLQAIGANLAGVVFNRAQAKDFEKSMSGLALRSRPNPNNPAAAGNTTNGAHVAKAVAGSFKRAG
jgi:capsular exopolysaccharide synthesis family protein